MGDVIVFSESPSGLNIEIGRAKVCTLSTNGVTVPNIQGRGIWAEARGQGGPLWVVLNDYIYKKPAPVIPQGGVTVNPPAANVNVPADLGLISRQLRDANLIIASLVHMLGGAVTIQPHEIEHARNLTLEAENLRDPFMVRIRALP